MNSWSEDERLRLRACKWLDEADRLGLFNPPPYNCGEARRAWRSGYEEALNDIAAGKLTLLLEPENTIRHYEHLERG